MMNNGHKGLRPTLQPLPQNNAEAIMVRPTIKICCISSNEEAQIAADAGANLLGLVGPMPSGPGILSLDQAAAIAAAHKGDAEPILLTASSTAAQIKADAQSVGVTHVQVVRHIHAAEAEALSKSGLTYFQVIHVEDDSALHLIPRYGGFCDAFLLDSGKPSAQRLGGTGAVHDWAVSAEFVRRSPVPVYLAGGLNPGNVAQAIETVRPHGVDICSGVRRDGHLDAALLARFIAAVESAGG